MSAEIASADKPAPDGLGRHHPSEAVGLGPKRTALIAAAWAEQKAIKEVMIFLRKHAPRVTPQTIPR